MSSLPCSKDFPTNNCLRIISILTKGRQYVSQLAREAEMRQPLLYLHLLILGNAGIVKTEMEVSDDERQ
ncbi:ArsR family transcriptional regulator [Cytobacillus sp. FJAT-53684]|uniref:ArsR family transcriptional regulator n=1 Tax=Cytobacillus mangrovibacter TaxID=3299024 RepID=A0ABW6JT92_9BACI